VPSEPGMRTRSPDRASRTEIGVPAAAWVYVTRGMATARASTNPGPFLYAVHAKRLKRLEIGVANR